MIQIQDFLKTSLIYAGNYVKKEINSNKFSYEDSIKICKNGINKYFQIK